MEPLVVRAVEVPCRPGSLLSCDTVVSALIGDVPMAQGCGRIQFLAHVPSANLLCGFCDTGVLLTWDAEELVFNSAFVPDPDDTSSRRQPFACYAASAAQPLVFTCSLFSRFPVVTDLSSRTSYKLRGSKKSIVALAAHPKAPLLASCSVDGEIRLWDYENQSVLSAVEGALPQSSKYLLAFDASGRSLVATCSAGYACAWHCPNPEDGAFCFLGSGAIPGLGTEGLWVVPTAGSDQRALVVTVDERGAMAAWDLAACSAALQTSTSSPALLSSGPLGESSVPTVVSSGAALAAAAQSALSNSSLMSGGKQMVLQPSVRLAGTSLPALLERTSAQLCPPYAIETKDPQVPYAHALIAHQSRQLLVSLPHLVNVVSESSGSSRVFVVALRDGAVPPCTAVAPLPSPTASEVAWGGRDAFRYSSSDGSDRAFFLGASPTEVLSCGAAGSPVQVFRQLPMPALAGATFMRPTRLVRSRAQAVLLVLYESSNSLSRTIQPAHYWTCFSTRAEVAQTAPRVLFPGRSATFMGPGDESLAVLSDDGSSISVCQASACLLPDCQWKLYSFPQGTPADRIFACPTMVDNSPTVVVQRQVAPMKNQLGIAALASGFQTTAHHALALEAESALQVVWQPPLGAVLLSSGRVLIVSHHLSTIATVSLPQPALALHWAGRALLASTETHVWSCYVDGTASRVLSLHARNSVVAGVLPDRLLLVCCGSASATRFGSCAYSRPFSLVEPLAIAEVACATSPAMPCAVPVPRQRVREELSATLAQLLSRYEWQRATPRLIERLISASAGDIAFAVSQKFEPLLPRTLVADAAAASLQFEQALAMLSEEIKTAPDYTRAGTATASAREHPLRSRFLALAQTCYAFGQYDTARKCIEASGDPLALLHHQAIVACSPKGVASLQAAVASEVPMAMACQALLAGSVVGAPGKCVDRVVYQSSLFSERPGPSVHTRAVATIDGEALAPMWLDQPKYWHPEVACAEETVEEPPEVVVVSPAAQAPSSPPAPATAATPTPPCESLSALMSYEIPSVLTLNDAQFSVTEHPASSSPPPAAPEVETNPPSASMFIKTLPVSFKPQPFVPNARVRAPSSIRRRVRPGEVPQLSELTLMSMPVTERRHSRKTMPPQLLLQVQGPLLQVNAIIEEQQQQQQLAQQQALQQQRPPSSERQGSSRSLRLHKQVLAAAAVPPEVPPSPHGSGAELPEIAPGSGTGSPHTTSSLREKRGSRDRHKKPSPSPDSSLTTTLKPPPITLAVPDRDGSPAKPGSADVSPPLPQPPSPRRAPAPDYRSPPPPAAQQQQPPPPPQQQQAQQTTLGRAPSPGHLRVDVSKAAAAAEAPPVSPRAPPGASPRKAEPLPSPRRLPVPQPQQQPQAPVPAVLASVEYREAKKTALGLWEKRLYEQCLEAVARCIRAVAPAAAASDQAAVEMRMLVAYRVAVSLLRMIAALSSEQMNAAAVALLSKFLADVPLGPAHRVDCIRLAIDKNMEAANYGVAASLLQVLMPHPLPDSAELAAKFKTCKSHKWANNALPMYTCPACQQPTSVANAACECGAPIRFCCLQFRLLEGPSMLHCPLCDSAFNVGTPTAVAGSKCPLCEAGTVEDAVIEPPPPPATTLSETQAIAVPGAAGGGSGGAGAPASRSPGAQWGRTPTSAMRAMAEHSLQDAGTLSTSPMSQHRVDKDKRKHR
eukprot:m51a1_g1761 TSET complex, TTRAY1 subunit (1688) ;mRNA; f:268160-274360